MDKGSMKHVIQQVKNKLFEIMDGVAVDFPNVVTKVAFIGFRDFGINWDSRTSVSKGYCTYFSRASFMS